MHLCLKAARPTKHVQDLESGRKVLHSIIMMLFKIAVPCPFFYNSNHFAFFLTHHQAAHWCFCGSIYYSPMTPLRRGNGQLRFCHLPQRSYPRQGSSAGVLLGHSASQRLLVLSLCWQQSLQLLFTPFSPQNTFEHVVLRWLRGSAICRPSPRKVSVHFCPLLPLFSFVHMWSCLCPRSLISLRAFGKRCQTSFFNPL